MVPVGTLSGWHVIDGTVLTTINLVYHPCHSTDHYQPGLSPMVQYWPLSAWYVTYGTVLILAAKFFIHSTDTYMYQHGLLFIVPGLTSISLGYIYGTDADLYQPGMSSIVSVLTSISLVPKLTSTSLVCHPWYQDWRLPPGMSSVVTIVISTSLVHVYRPWYRYWHLSALFVTISTGTDICRHGLSCMITVLTSINLVCHPWYSTDLCLPVMSY